MRFRRILFEYFTFTRSERRGLLVLIFLIFLFITANQLIFYFETPTLADRNAFEKAVAMYKREQPKKNDKSLFYFDPNRIEPLALDSLDLPAHIKRNMVKYRNAGGEFYVAADLRKIYGMNDSLFEVISPFIQIEKIDTVLPVANSTAINRHKTVEIDRVAKKKPTVDIPDEKVELNNATAEELKKLRGIGDVLSKRVIKFRDKLGGFYQLDQLKEVYGLPGETYAAIENKLALDTTLVRKIDVNFASSKELGSHPYLTWDDVDRMIAYRSKHGFITDKSLLLKDSVLEEVVYRKICPYLRSGN